MAAPAPGSKIYADELLALVDRRIVRLQAVGTQALPDATITAITFGAGSEQIDTHGLHNEAVNPTRVTIDRQGYYECKGGVHFASQATPVMSAAWIRVNGLTGVAPAGRIPGTGNTFSALCFATVLCDVGDYIELVASQDSAGADDTAQSLYFSSVLEVVYLRGPL